eukprot:TRINITY_DN43163_c0_g1_i1.p1 TRINITY_DN43163_c0_g1~~TRINITY_DN43163_c0_g1_i1.p1  ORF type:complete len:436 (+),score=94.25 TRINITY_DN43163_c0_g1_i1:58-1365(+)
MPRIAERVASSAVKETALVAVRVNGGTSTVACASGGPASKAKSAEVEAAASGEANLFELVRMIKDWVERSFSPVQEARIQEKGRLCGRFKVKLGEEMSGQLKAYIAASFALRLLVFRVVPVTKEGSRAPPQEAVEVILTPEARALYAEKMPEAVNKHKLQLQTVGGDDDGLVDVDGEGNAVSCALAAPPQLAVEDCSRRTDDHNVKDRASTRRDSKKCREMEEPVLAIVPVVEENGGTNAVTSEKRGADSGIAAVQKAFGKRAAARFSAQMMQSNVAEMPQKRKASAPLAIEDAGVKRAAVTPQPAEAAVEARSGVAPVAPKGSPWGGCVAFNVRSGTDGLLEAKDGLDSAWAKRGRGGVEMLKAEKEAVSWLKGLTEREVGAIEMRETKIGLSVNEWRKHEEQYVSALAVSLLTAWKRAWRDAEKKDRASKRNS